MVTPEMLTVAEAMLNTRLARFPLMARAVAPGPTMLRSLLIASSPLVNVIVPMFVSSNAVPGAALEMACRREPAPLSARLVTVPVTMVKVRSVPYATPRLFEAATR